MPCSKQLSGRRRSLRSRKRSKRRLSKRRLPPCPRYRASSGGTTFKEELEKFVTTYESSKYDEKVKEEFIEHAQKDHLRSQMTYNDQILLDGLVKVVKRYNGSDLVAGIRLAFKEDKDFESSRDDDAYYAIHREALHALSDRYNHLAKFKKVRKDLARMRIDSAQVSDILEALENDAKTKINVNGIPRGIFTLHRFLSVRSGLA